MEFLVKVCTSPVRSSYREVVAKKLAAEINRRCTTMGERRGIQGFNEKAGEYAIDLGRALELINQNHTWTERGQLLDLIAEVDVNGATPEKQIELNPAERLLHFLIFLEGDGAAMLFLARYFLENRAIANLHSPDTVNHIAQEMFIEVLSQYYELTDAPAERVKLRRYIDGLRAKPFRGKGGTHKLKLHLQTLHRLGFLELDGSCYRLPTESGHSGPSLLAALCNEIPDVVVLEKIVGSKRSLDVAANVFNLSGLDTSTPQADEIIPVIVFYYSQIMANGTPLASLSTLIEAVQIRCLIKGRGNLSFNALQSLIVQTQKENAKDVRLHVDRRGRPAFLKLSPRFIEAFSDNKVVA
jgi:hypothetical protein